MDEYERELDRVRKARAEFEASQDEVERRKQDYFTAVRTLHETGMPLREIATALGLSHQRVHQMVEEATGKKPSRLRGAGRIAKQSGLGILLVLATLGGYAALTDEIPDPRVASLPSPSDTKIEKPNSKKPCQLHFYFPRNQDARTFHFEPRHGLKICMPDPEQIFKGFEENHRQLDAKMRSLMEKRRALEESA